MTTTPQLTVAYNYRTSWTVYAAETTWSWEKGDYLFSVTAETLEDALAIAIHEAELDLIRETS